MGNFGFIIGSLISFIVIIGIFTGSFVIYKDSIVNNYNIIKDLEKKEILYNNNYNINNPFIDSGRLTFYINSSKDISFKDTKNYCFEFFVNNNFYNFERYNLNIKNPSLKNYYYINKNENGIITLKGIFNTTNNYILKSISCSGLKKKININKSNIDWWDKDWKKRLIIKINNKDNLTYSEYQAKIILNSSNFDFNKYESKSIAIVEPLKENLVLDVNFDNYKQELNDFSKNKKILFLGNTNLPDSSDPSITDGVLFSGLSFDGANDYVTILSNKELNINKEITISAWIKWNQYGNTLQNIYTNGIWTNSLRIVNDGSLNDKKILFQLNISNNVYYLYSNKKIEDNNWHLITATYDGNTMKIYIDGTLDSKLDVVGKIIYYDNTNYIGTEGTNYFFNGSIDELKIYNIALTNKEVNNLYYNRLRFRELDFYIAKWDKINQKGIIYVKIPMLIANNNISIQLYYDNPNNPTEKSNIKNTFSYKELKLIGFVVSQKIVNSGLRITCIEEKCRVAINNLSNIYNLNRLDTITFSSAELKKNTSIYSDSLIQVEGTGNVNDIIAPISFAGKKFDYAGFRDSYDHLCMLSPWGTAWVNITFNGALVWNGTITSSGYCYTTDLSTTSTAEILSNKDILVSYYGNGGYDSYVMYPSIKDEYIYGVPSCTLYIGSGEGTSSVNILRSDGYILNQNLGSYSRYYISGNGAEGTSFSYKIYSKKDINAIQQADTDGTESTTFVPEEEMGTLFGSYYSLEYIAIVSPYENANCSVYDINGLVDNQVYGTGTNGVYKYYFGVSDDSVYLTTPWYLKCDKKVWAYYEQNQYSDERNLIGYLQIRQFSPYIKTNIIRSDSII